MGINIQTFVSSFAQTKSLILYITLTVLNSRAVLLYCPNDVWDFERYYNNSEIADFLTDLSANCPHATELLDIGESYEGRTMTAIRIGNQEDVRNIWVDGGIHAREWIAHVTTMYIACELCNSSSDDAAELVDRWNWFLLPVVNPDAYEYTWTTDRMWRKTRQPNDNSTCVGRDPNRNFDYQWGSAPDQTDPCSNNYQGPEAFSEPEVKNIADFVLGRQGSWDAYLNVHSALQAWIPPWGYTEDLPPDWEDLERVGTAAVNATRDVHGKDYTFYRTEDNSGTAKDWAHGGAGIKYVYTVELRWAENWTYRHILPPEEIIPTGEETWAGIVAMAREIHSIEYSSKAAVNMVSLVYLCALLIATIDVSITTLDYL